MIKAIFVVENWLFDPTWSRNWKLTKCFVGPFLVGCASLCSKSMVMLKYVSKYLSQEDRRGWMKWYILY